MPKRKKFDPQDPFPPYPPPEPEEEARDPDDFDPGPGWREFRGPYDADSVDAEGAYYQGVEDLQSFIRGD